MTFTTGALFQAFNTIRSKCDDAVGAATAFELRLRIIAQLEPKVQAALKEKTKMLYHKAYPYFLIPAILKVFQDELNLDEREEIENCRLPRNKVSHDNLVEFMIELSGEALGREIDPKTGKGKPIKENDIIEGVTCIERNGCLEKIY